MQHKFTITVLLLTFLILSCTEKQNPVTPVEKGSIKGFISDAKTNIPLSNVFVITHPSTKEIYSDSNGEFIIVDIPVGDYMVFASISGYDNNSVLVNIKSVDTITVNISLINFSEYFDYYPLDIGNYWEYEFGSSIFSIAITRDTIISNKEYKIILEKYIPSGNIRDIRYERLDSLTSLVYKYYPDWEYEVIVDSLAAKPGQVFTNNMFDHPTVIRYSILATIKEENVLEHLTNIRSVHRDIGLPYPYYETAFGIGLNIVSFHRSGSIILKYAKIRGIEYGEKN